MPSEDHEILEFNQNQKYDKAPFILYADLECFIGQIDGCKKYAEVKIAWKSLVNN